MSNNTLRTPPQNYRKGLRGAELSLFVETGNIQDLSS